MANLYERANTESSEAFLEELIAAVPYPFISSLLTTVFNLRICRKTARVQQRPSEDIHLIVFAEKNNTEHRPTKPNHSWTNGQVEHINRTIKEATVNRYYYQKSEPL